MKSGREALLMVMVLAMVFAGCGKQRNTDPRLEARNLYGKNMSMLRMYIDSVENARDSASVNRLIVNYGEKQVKLYYDFPPDTDLKLTEDENDTLSVMTERLLSAREEKLRRFAHAGIESIDSINSSDIDSIRLSPSSRNSHNRN